METFQLYIWFLLRPFLSAKQCILTLLGGMMDVSAGQPSSSLALFAASSLSWNGKRFEFLCCYIEYEGPNGGRRCVQGDHN